MRKLGNTGRKSKSTPSAATREPGLGKVLEALKQYRLDSSKGLSPRDAFDAAKCRWLRWEVKKGELLKARLLPPIGPRLLRK